MAASCGLGRRGRPSASWPRSATTRSTASRIGGEERKLLSIDRSRKSRLDRRGLAREPGAGDVEARRVGALEAEDRLLVVADGEDRPVAPRRALAGEIFERQRADDVPLAGRWCPAPRRPGYGRSAGRACSAPNRPCPGVEQQLLRLADQVVEIDQARPRAWPRHRPSAKLCPARSPAASDATRAASAAHQQQPAAAIGRAAPHAPRNRDRP